MRRAIGFILTCCLLMGMLCACGEGQQETVTGPAESTAPAQVYDPNKLFGVLDYSKVWKITTDCKGVITEASFLFEDDGTVYLTIADGGQVHSAGRGTYKLSENIIDVSVWLNAQQELAFTYSFDGAGMCFVQESGDGVLAVHTKGQSLPLEESAHMDAETVRENADLYSKAADAPDPNVAPYQEKVKNTKLPIFAGPGYEYQQVDTVKEAGEYTIIEEAEDTLGNLWGRLESGAGWIDLTAVRTTKKSEAPISLRYGSRSDLQNSDYGCTVDASAYSFVALVTANETVTEFALYDLTYSYAAGTRHYYLDELPAGSHFAASVSLPGDMSIMGISFVDAYGTPRRFYFYISGLDGSLKLSEY